MLSLEAQPAKSKTANSGVSLQLAWSDMFGLPEQKLE